MLNATINNGSVAQLNRALDYGSRGYRFESCRNHKRNIRKSVPFFVLQTTNFSNDTNFNNTFEL